MEAGDLSLMLRKSVEARDWLATLEPRSVRAVMKRIVEDVTIIGLLFFPCKNVLKCSVSDPDSGVFWIRIRIRIRNPDPVA